MLKLESTKFPFLIHREFWQARPVLVKHVFSLKISTQDLILSHIFHFIAPACQCLFEFWFPRPTFMLSENLTSTLYKNLTSFWERCWRGWSQVLCKHATRNFCSSLLHFFFFGPTRQNVESYFPDQELNLYPLHWKCRAFTTGPPGKSLNNHLYSGDWMLSTVLKVSICVTSHWVTIIILHIQIRKASLMA